MSTDLSTSPVPVDRVLDQAWELAPSVALRHESFGALAYHFGTRRLTFLKAPALVRVLQSLADRPTARDAIAASAVPEAHRAAYAATLADLAAQDVIRPRPGQEGP